MAKVGWWGRNCGLMRQQSFTLHAGDLLLVLLSPQFSLRRPSCYKTTPESRRRGRGIPTTMIGCGGGPHTLRAKRFIRCVLR